MVQLSQLYMTSEKNIALSIWTFVSEVMSLFLNTLSRFVIALLPRSKHLLILWLQSPSIVILEPNKIKSVTVSTPGSSVVITKVGRDNGQGISKLLYAKCLRLSSYMSPKIKSKKIDVNTRCENASLLLPLPFHNCFCNDAWLHEPHKLKFQ